MAKANARPEKESLKRHGDAMESKQRNASHSEKRKERQPGTPGSAKSEERDADRQKADGIQRDAVPMPEDGSHGKSHAAHLGAAHEHTKPERGMRNGKTQGELRQPPMMQQRIGRQAR